MFSPSKPQTLRLCLGAALLSLSSAALAVASTTYGFTGVSNNNAANTALGVASLSLTVIDLGGSQVAFQLTNSSASLTDVYFDDGTLLGIASITGSGSGVDFSQGASPPDLPGGNNLTPAFVTTAGFSADSNSPASPNGIGFGESLTITFNLQGGQDYNDVISALALPNGGGGDLRIGVHVQSYANGGSESFVNVPDGITSPVPEADTYAMLLAGLGLMGFMSRQSARSGI